MLNGIPPQPDSLFVPCGIVASASSAGGGPGISHCPYFSTLCRLGEDESSWVEDLSSFLGWGNLHHGAPKYWWLLGAGISCWKAMHGPNSTVLFFLSFLIWGSLFQGALFTLTARQPIGSDHMFCPNISERLAVPVLGKCPLSFPCDGSQEACALSLTHPWRAAGLCH